MTITSNRLLAALEPDLLREIEPHLERQPFGSGTVFFEAGRRIDHVWFPLDGVVSIVSVMRDGQAVETATIGRESAVGLLSAFGSSFAFSRAIGQVAGETMAIEGLRLKRIFMRSESFRSLVMRNAEMVLTQAQQSVACNALHTLESRFARWLLMCQDRTGRSEIGLTQEFLAEMLGVQRTTVTAVARNIRTAGMINYSRGKIQILDRRGLRARSCECYRAVQDQIDDLLPNRPAADTPARGGVGKTKALP